MLLLLFRWLVSLTTPQHLTQTHLTLMTQATHLLVFLTAVTEFTLTHMRVVTTWLLAIKVLLHSMQVFSTAHTFLYRWFVRLVRTPSSQKSALRLATAWLQIHLHKVPIKALALLQLTQTSTTDAH